MILQKNNLNEETLLRLKIAKVFFDLVKEKMGKNFSTAFIFGSTCRNQAKEHSDIDIVFVLKRGSKEERRRLNSPEGGIWDKDRHGMVLMVQFEQYITIYRRQLESDYRVPISPYYYYPNNKHNDGICFLNGNLSSLKNEKDHQKLFKKVIEGAVHYPRDFEKLGIL